MLWTSDPVSQAGPSWWAAGPNLPGTSEQHFSYADITQHTEGAQRAWPWVELDRFFPGGAADGVVMMPLRWRGSRYSFASCHFHWYFYWYQLQLVLGSQHSHRLPEGLEQLCVISPRLNYPLYNRDENNTCLLSPPCLYLHWPLL